MTDRKASGEMGKISQKNLKELSAILYRKFRKERKEKNYARVKEILTLLAKGGFLLSCFLAPGAAKLAPAILAKQPEKDEWQKFHKSYLRRSIKRLKKRGLIREDEDKAILRISERGGREVLKYALDNFKIEKPKSWDSKWRLIIYDVPTEKRYFQDLFRETIKKLGLFQLQESVYLTPFPCYNQVQMLREYFGVKNEVLYLVVDKFEHEGKYRKHFDF